MSDDKEEKPTQQRLKKARKEGQFAVSREFLSAVQFLVFLVLLGVYFGAFFTNTLNLMRLFLANAVSIQITPRELSRIYRHVFMTLAIPMLMAGAGLMAVAIAVQMGMTGGGIAAKKLAPDLKRLNPMQKLKDLPKQGIPGLFTATLMLIVSGFTIYYMVQANLPTYLALPLVSIEQAYQAVGSSLETLLWRVAYLLLALGCLDFVRQKRKLAKSLRMSKQEIKEEHKESEGNPQMKGRIRRLQREAARKNMLKEVAKATGLVVNPTHYAVAIHYDLEAMAAPRVLAKGKNYLARRIREIANEHNIPIVENAPLAQALYKSVDVGQEIPAHLYKAVAEILAYIFKLMPNRR